MNQGPKWILLMKKTRAVKSPATVTLILVFKQTSRVLSREISGSFLPYIGKSEQRKEIILKISRCSSDDILKLTF
jgi:hypothetical protein